METIIGSVITGVLALAGVIYTTRKTHQITLTEIKSELDLTRTETKGTIKLVNKDVTTLRDDLTSLDKHVKEHNNLVVRLYEVEKGVELLDDRLKVANHRIKDLERGMDNGRD
jgi:predicted  nucleic acid-binding Zn-ribbon protein